MAASPAELPSSLLIIWQDRHKIGIPEDAPFIKLFYTISLQSYVSAYIQLYGHESAL